MEKPSHIAIIMDGNGRWAEQRDLPRLKGHEAGSETVRRVIRLCRDHGVKFLTLYAFSTENWKRSKDEVDGLMALLKQFLEAHEDSLHEQKIALRIMGRRSDLAPDLVSAIEAVEARTAHYDAGCLQVALSYGGRAEIADAARDIARAAKAGTLDPETVDEVLFSKFLYLPDLPDPDLVIRTSGELRISNFLLWQAAYSEFFVTPTLWPDFDAPDFEAALEAYGKRKRRYGGRK
jgi:undecaprenyl diphosphate synthase